MSPRRNRCLRRKVRRWRVQNRRVLRQLIGSIGFDAPKYLLGERLGSASAVVSADGTAAQTQGYYPWGETRFGDVGTEYQYTGQYRLAALGLDYFNARWYDSALGRFAQADSIVPLASQGAQAWDRYAFVNNNPARYTDPSGHFAIIAALALITPIGWSAIGVTVLAVGVYFAVPGVRPAVTAAIEETGEAISDALNPGSEKPDTTKPGPYADESIEARSPDRDFTEEEREAIDAIGQATGCHSCGIKNPGTKSGHFVPDHQPPSSLNPSNLPQRLYPHCLSCSRTQGGQITEKLRRGGLLIPLTLIFEYQY